MKSLNNPKIDDLVLARLQQMMLAIGNLWKVQLQKAREQFFQMPVVT